MRGMIAAVVTSFLCVGVHFLLARSGRLRDEHEHPIRKLIYHGKVLLAVWMALFPLFLVLFYAIGERDMGPFFYFFYGVIFFGMCFFLYLTVYYVADRSVSSRIMIEIEASPKASLTFQELVGVYDADTKYTNELKGMAEGGFIRESDGYYSNTLKGRIVAKIAGWYKRAFRLGRGG